MKTNKKAGISLIVLVITIIVIIILAGAVILSLASNNPISQASKATYLSDVRNFQTELGLYETNQFADKLGAYDPAKLQADETSVTYDGVVDTSKTMNDLIPTLGKATKYSGQFIVVDGKLVFQGSDTKRQDWSREAEIEVLIVGEPKVTIIAPSETVVASGTDMIYTVKFTSNAALTTIDLTNKVEVLDNSGVALPIQPVITIGTISGTSSDATRQVDITIKTDSLVTGGYKLKIKSGSVTNVNNISNTQDIVSLIGFDIADNIPPENPTMSASPTAWTNGNVTVTITYSGDTVLKEYSFDSTNWNNYTSPVSVTDNNTTIYSRGKDAAGNESGVATLTVTNIDKVVPIVTASNGGSTSSSVTVTAVASDVGGSGINTASYQYSKDNGVTWTTTTSATSYTFTALSTGTYQCKVKVVDNVLNSTTSNSVTINTQGLGTITLSANPTAWTNGNVNVTITYPAAVVTKQYSLDGTNWNTYTTPVVVSTNNTTVYAKGSDAGGNQTAQATLTVSNIDKTVPTVAFGTNGGSNSTMVSTTVTISDTGSSGINNSTIQYVWDTQNVVTPSSGWTVFTNGQAITKSVDGTYYLWIKASDNVGNSIVDKSNAFIIGEVVTQVTTVQTINKTFSGATTGFSYNNPVIPAGFVAIDTDDAKWTNLSTDWDKGLVIQDVSGNRFVWVPIDGSSVTYTKWCTTGVAYNDSNISDDTLPSGFTSTNITNTYKGFYIGRYEAMFDYNGGSIRVASKKSTNKGTIPTNNTHTGYLWIYPSYTNAKLYAENMAASYGYDTTKIGTNLVTGAQWDATMKWIQNSGKSVVNSSTWGNHQNSASPANIVGYGNLQISGYSNYWKVKNIFDLAGNAREWTSEKYSTNYICRGGDWANDGITYHGAANRYQADAVNSSGLVMTFRVALYVK